jgi:hypothetical protein
MSRTAGLGRRHLAVIPGDSPPFVIKTQPVSERRLVSAGLCYPTTYLPVWPRY